jgi:RNA polymerase sigma factor (sigma-70 family)
MTPPPAENFAARIFLGPALRAQPDRRLVDLVRDGYDAAFEEIVHRYRRPLDRFAAAIVGGRSEDVTQDAFSKALLALRGTEAEVELRPWLYRIVRNTALNDLRDRAPEAAELSEELPGGRSVAAEAEAREELTELMERLRALPEPQRAALVMRELEGLSHEEIAVALGVSGGAARQAIYRARAALRDGLGLLVPLPLLRALAEGGSEAAAAGGAIAAGAGASSAGGAVLGGLGGGGAAKAGLATVLVAGAVGAGVAVENRGGNDRGPEAAQAAPATPGSQLQGASEGSGSSGSGGGSLDSSGPGGGDDDSSEPGSGSDDDRRENGREDEDRRSGSSGSGSSGGGDDFDPDDDGDSSGPGSGSSGDDDFDSSGSGSGGDEDFDDD